MEKKFFIDWNNEIPQEEFINNILGGMLRGKLSTDNRHVC